ncbi:MAG: TspO/MBR family protein [Flavobacteriales bacterium]
MHLSPSAKYAIAIGGTLLIGSGSALAMGDSLEQWYSQLAKPWGQPPPWVFAPVWTVLYILMGTAAGLVWTHDTAPGARRALALYVIQLGLNAVWSVIFFGMRSPQLALGDIFLLLAMIIALMRLFSKVHRTAGWLLLPYLLWVAFATYLNAGVVVLN